MQRSRARYSKTSWGACSRTSLMHSNHCGASKNILVSKVETPQPSSSSPESSSMESHPQCRTTKTWITIRARRELSARTQLQPSMAIVICTQHWHTTQARPGIKKQSRSHSPRAFHASISYQLKTIHDQLSPRLDSKTHSNCNSNSSNTLRVASQKNTSTICRQCSLLLTLANLLTRRATSIQQFKNIGSLTRKRSKRQSCILWMVWSILRRASWRRGSYSLSTSMEC